MILLADSEYPDQTARMRRLIWAFAVHIYPQTRFRVGRLIYQQSLIHGYASPLETSLWMEKLI